MLKNVKRGEEKTMKENAQTNTTEINQRKQTKYGGAALGMKENCVEAI